MPVWIPVRLRGTAVVGGIQKPDHKLLLTHKDDEQQNNNAILMKRKTRLLSDEDALYLSKVQIIFVQNVDYISVQIPS